MSFPGSGLETTYRNNLREVAKMLQTNHQDKYMVRADRCLGPGPDWGVGGGVWGAISGLLGNICPS